MLFNSYEFIFIFLPITWSLFYFASRLSSKQLKTASLCFASLFFYAWWNPKFVLFILSSIGFNYLIGKKILKAKQRRLLWLGILVNLIFLGYFKYTNFILDNLNFVLNSSFQMQKIILPLAISFFTFQQIAFLVDVYQEKIVDVTFSTYFLFVTFFPQLIAGPIVHYKHLIPQFKDQTKFKADFNNLSLGAVIFVLGLFKKVVIADGISEYANPVFSAAAHGTHLDFLEAWGGALSYTFQLYFDFSGYSDMAIGLGRMFGIKIPLNFNSPYKSPNIIQFWRRWHITLSVFLRDYLYIPLGGSRKGKLKRYTNLMITMILGGLWHGAGWTFIIWGSLHGVFLVINHTWQALLKFPEKTWQSHWAYIKFSQLLTFICVVFAWVYFRSSDFHSAHHMIKAMIGLNGINIPEDLKSWKLITLLNQYFAINYVQESLFHRHVLRWFAFAGAICFFLPNPSEFLADYHPAFEKILSSSKIRWRFNALFGFFITIIFCISVIYVTRKSEFLYFQF